MRAIDLRNFAAETPVPLAQAMLATTKNYGPVGKHEAELLARARARVGPGEAFPLDELYKGKWERLEADRALRRSLEFRIEIRPAKRKPRGRAWAVRAGLSDEDLKGAVVAAVEIVERESTLERALGMDQEPSGAMMEIVWEWAAGDLAAFNVVWDSLCSPRIGDADRARDCQVSQRQLRRWIDGFWKYFRKGLDSGKFRARDAAEEGP